MSYNCNDVNCERVMRVSSSDSSRRYMNYRFGDSNHDNARQINEKSIIIANYRASKKKFLEPTVSPTIALAVTSTAAPTVAPTVAPTIPPTHPPSPNYKPLNCKWNESLLEVIVKTSSDINPQQISWILKNRTNSIEIGSNNNHNYQYNKANALITHQKCVIAASCYKFIIYDKDGAGITDGDFVKILESGETVLEVNLLNINSVSAARLEYSIPVEGRMKHQMGWPGMGKVQCKWLKSQNVWKQRHECSKPYVKSKCVNVCNTCNV